jgi:hypothetical protein
MDPIADATLHILHLDERSHDRQLHCFFNERERC